MPALSPREFHHGLLGLQFREIGLGLSGGVDRLGSAASQSRAEMLMFEGLDLLSWWLELARTRSAVEMERGRGLNARAEATFRGSRR